MKNILRPILFVLILCVSCNIEHQHNKKDIKIININLDSLISKLADDYIEYQFAYNNPEFREIYNNPTPYFMQIKKYLQKFDTTNIKADLDSISKSNRYLFKHELEFRLATYLVEKIDVNKYLEICYIALHVFDVGLMTSDNIMFLISGHVRDSPIKNNLNDEDVQIFLKKVVEHPKVEQSLKKIIYTQYIRD